MHRRLPRAERRAQLIDVATAKFGERGFFPTSMDDIAEAAGITKPVLYQHFASKEDLYIAVIENIGSRIEERIDALQHDNTTTRARVEAGISAFFDLLEDQPSTLQLFFGSEYITEKVQREVETAVNKAAASVGRVISRKRNLEAHESAVIGRCFAASLQAAAKHASSASPEALAEIRATLATFFTAGLEPFQTN